MNLRTAVLKSTAAAALAGAALLGVTGVASAEALPTQQAQNVTSTASSPSASVLHHKVTMSIDNQTDQNLYLSYAESGDESISGAPAVIAARTTAVLPTQDGGSSTETVTADYYIGGTSGVPLAQFEATDQLMGANSTSGTTVGSGYTIDSSIGSGDSPTADFVLLF